jgi:hypothetical protein
LEEGCKEAAVPADVTQVFGARIYRKCILTRQEFTSCTQQVPTKALQHGTGFDETRQGSKRLV